MKKVFASNLGPFLQSESLPSGRERRRPFYNARRVGVRVALDTLEIPDQRNSWLEHELDLGALIAEGERGLFLVELRFAQEDMLYRPAAGAEEIRRHYGQRSRGRGRDYYSDPTARGYVRVHGRAAKALIVSDIGLTYKRGHDQHLVYATRLDDARPLPGVEVTLRTYQNQVVGRGTTDDRGLASFEGVTEEIFFVEAEHRGQRSLIKPGDMAWNLSTFDVGGVEARPGPRAFIYTERGVYRPGDEINLSVIARHPDYTFPDDHPATCRIFNPKNQMVFEQVRRGAREGLYSFSFATGVEDPTGNWRARVRIGDSTFDHVLKIETVVPYRLKTEIAPDKERLGREDEVLKADLRSAYLFGTPAAGLQAELSVSLQSAPKGFPRYEGFTFTNEAIDYRPVSAVIFKGRLDGEGKARVEWTLPEMAGAPSALQALLTARVLEKGGRPNHGRQRIPIDPYDHYVGLKKPDLDYGYTRVGAPVAIPAVAVDVDGNPVAGRSLRYRVYRGTTHWWWEYENRQAFRRRFKSDRRTELVSEERIVSALTPVDLLFDPEERGEYLIEVADGGDRGHAAAFFVRAYHWGRTPAAEGNEGMLVLKADRERYQPGDEALIRFPVPGEGSVLFSVEQGGRVLDSRWYRLDGSRDEASIPVPVTADMVPTAYATVSLIQPYAQTGNDRPLRLFGVVPIEVHEPETRLDSRHPHARPAAPRRALRGRGGQRRRFRRLHPRGRRRGTSRPDRLRHPGPLESLLPQAAAGREHLRPLRPRHRRRPGRPLPRLRHRGRHGRQAGRAGGGSPPPPLPSRLHVRRPPEHRRLGPRPGALRHAQLRGRRAGHGGRRPGPALRPRRKDGGGEERADGALHPAAGHRPRGPRRGTGLPIRHGRQPRRRGGLHPGGGTAGRGRCRAQAGGSQPARGSGT